MQYALLDTSAAKPAPGGAPARRRHRKFSQQLLKWIGNKQRFAHEIADFLPERFGTYHEPFLGSGAVLGTIAPPRAFGSDCFGPLVGIWQTLKRDPDLLVSWYAERLRLHARIGKQRAYEDVLASYNARPNAADFIFLSRACYGGVVRFRKDGYMSTPCGVHEPIPARAFAARVQTWHHRVKGTEFAQLDYEEAMARAMPGDVVYCDPPYSHTQAILYGAQDFSLARLLGRIAACKARGVQVLLSIDGTKKSGSVLCDVPIPDGLFVHEVAVNVGRSMLRRFQRGGDTLEDEVVHDRLLMTF